MSSEAIRRRVIGMTLLLALVGLPSTVLPQTSSPEFGLRNGDVVVFIGDSNTQWGSYPREIENYTVLRYPERHIRFINAGLDGDMASQAYFRLDRDVFARGATVLFVLFGVNDISYGNYAGDEYRKVFLDYTIKIVEASRAHNVRVYVLTYPITSAPVGEKAADRYSRFLATLTATDTSLLQRLGDEAAGLSKSHGASTIDVEREMRRVAATAPPGTRFHQDDGVHLNDFGNQALAFAVLKGLGAPPFVSSVEIDAASLAIKSDGAVVTGAKRAGNSIEFTRRDYALPLTFWNPLERSGASIENIFAPINAFFLTYANLPAGTRYTLKADELDLSPPCGFTSEQLGRRVNLATLKSSYYQPRGPWAQQAIVLARTTEAKAALEWALFYQGKEGLATSAWRLFKARADSAIATAAKAQSAIGRARPNRYVLSPLTADSAAVCAVRR